MDQAVIETTDLTKTYGSSRGISEVNLTVRPGEVYGFLGPNGAGKTTTIRLLLGLIRPTSGSILLFGQPARTHRREAAKLTGYVPGDVALYRDLSGEAYLSHLLALRTGLRDKAATQRLQRLQSRFQIDLSRKIKTYSKGMKQAVAIIQAFMHGPKLVIMDEPTSGLDPIMQETVYDLLLEERDKGHAIFFSTHVLSEVERVCDRVGIIKDGRLIRVEELSSRRSFMGKKIILDLETDPALLLDHIRALPGVADPRQAGPNRIQLFFKGRIKDFLSLIAAEDIRDLTCLPPTLEDFFFSLYEG
ncbi:MAG: ABC transporter ATP-binding protein [Proteobacteria bacterium]|nr:ABC transporter ATP-binding protein [Pseudomonadota bacterium]